MHLLLPLATLLVGSMADSTLDWYDPTSTISNVYCGDSPAQYQECGQYAQTIAGHIADGVGAQCKTASCSGTFSTNGFDITVDAVFPETAKDELITQVHNIMGKMIKTEYSQLQAYASYTYPSKLILNRQSDDTERGHMEITIAQHSDDGVCAALKVIGAAGGLIPEVGAFFGLISIADC